jgi:hypothetical protein
LDENEFDSTVGLALHEGSHIALTDFNHLRDVLAPQGVYINRLCQWHMETFKENVTSSSMMSQVKDLINIIEDRRIDRFIYDSAPGYQGYYKSLYEKYFNSSVIDKALINGLKTELNWDSYLFHICNFTNSNRQLNALPGLRNIWDTISISTISRLKSTSEVTSLAIEVYKMIWTELGGKTANELNQASNQMPQAQNSGIDPNLDMQGDSAGASEGNESYQEEEIPKTAKEIKEAEKADKDLEIAIQKQKDFLNGDIKKRKLSKSDAQKINAAAESNINYQPVGGDIPNTNYNETHKNSMIPCMVVKGVTNQLIDSSLLSIHTQNAESFKASLVRYRKPDAIAEGIMLGTLLGKRLKTRDEDRSMKTMRMETGHIDRRLIAELGFGNDRVFSQTIHHTVTPSLIHISIDASGSMSGEKWNAAIKTAVAIAKAASMVSSLDCVISLRGTYGYSETPLMWTVYDSRKDVFNVFKEKMYSIRPNGSTPEGLCYQAVMKDIIDSANGKEAFFINICDGEPGFSTKKFNYQGSYAINHTAIQIKKMHQAGIKTLAYFVCENNNSPYMVRAKDNFRTMYGANAEFINITNLTQLSNSINKLFVRK